MKFEFQTTNKILRNDGKTASELERKYGPEDFLVKGASGVRLESETGGVLEFETGWSKKWPKLREQIQEAVAMTTSMNAAKAASAGRKHFPFDVAHLRAGTKRELRRGVWSPREGKEGEREKILGAAETLEVHIGDATWNSGIQSSESFELGQYESFLKEHEWPDYRDPVIASATDILTAANTEGIAARKLDGLRNFLEIIVNYVMRGMGGASSASAGASADVKGRAAKQAFILMNRTDFSSIYRSLLDPTERRLFRRIVARDTILTKMGLTRKIPFFVHGYGMKKHHAGPTVHQWLKGIPSGTDVLAGKSGSGLSDAMGRFDVETKKGRKDTGLVKFETRNRNVPGTGAWSKAKDWEALALALFKSAASKRSRPTGKGETGLETT